MTTPAFKPVDLVDPEGRPYTAATAIEFHDLHYGLGYSIAKPTAAEPASDAGSSTKSRKTDTTTTS